ncbi:MAG: DUF1697 domain-containing protein [Terracidiphilus sp.]
MPTYVILLRAVNLAGYGKLPMADFRKLLAGLRFERVETYIQSGNAVVDAKGTAETVAKAVAAGMEKLMGAPAGVVVRTHEQLDRVIRENPFAAEAVDGTKVHVGFLAGSPGKEAAGGLDRIVAKYPKRRDRYRLIEDTLYLHLPDGAAETKFTGKSLDKALGVMGTARNWNTVLKLHEMSKRKL